MLLNIISIYAEPILRHIQNEFTIGRSMLLPIFLLIFLLNQINNEKIQILNEEKSLILLTSQRYLIQLEETNCFMLYRVLRFPLESSVR